MWSHGDGSGTEVEQPLIPLAAVLGRGSNWQSFPTFWTVTIMEPLTEQRRVSGPVVYGFLRLVGLSAARQRALTTAINEYCKSHELTLGGMFTERCTSTAAAFTGLLQVLKIPGSYGVVLPAPSHLGPRELALDRQRLIDAAGAHLLFVRGAHRIQQASRRPERAPALEAES